MCFWTLYLWAIFVSFAEFEVWNYSPHFELFPHYWLVSSNYGFYGSSTTQIRILFWRFKFSVVAKGRKKRQKKMKLGILPEFLFNHLAFLRNNCTHIGLQHLFQTIWYLENSSLGQFSKKWTFFYDLFFTLTLPGLGDLYI